MNGSDVAKTCELIARRAHDSVSKLGLKKGITVDASLMSIVRKLSNGYGHVRRAGALAETRTRADGRRYGFGVDMARAVVGILSLCHERGIDIGTLIVEELERVEAKAKKT